ncbi:TraM recognition domain-containing protein [Nocardioides sp. W7]|uniref:type IV secretory system conjugative DNA transfer family protein n=1 Tax=Nocardioides sp. W7 TaxID=2931390 RepID=UPI001FD1C619|nr:TraM recognition domain-containing protein [Nocardioides sp. W7]
MSRSFPAEGEIGITPRTANKHTVVYAPSQIGKSTSIIAPWIHAAMGQGYFVVALDLKGNGDLLDMVQTYARAAGDLPDVALTNFDYTDAQRSATWNWISDLNGEDGAITTAATAIIGDDREVDPNREFRLRDLKWLQGLLEYASTSDHPWTVASLLRLLHDQPRLAQYVGNDAPQRAQTRLRDLISLSPDDYHTRVQFLVTYLEALNTHDFNRVTGRRGIDLSRVSDEPGLLVVTAPLAHGRSSTAVSGLFLSQFIRQQMLQFNRSSRPVLLVLDEAPRLADRLNLAQLLTTSASSGMSILLALQEVTDFDEQQRETILANCGTHILMAGAGPETTDYFGRRLGNRTVARQTQSMNHSRQSGATFQTGVQNSDVPVLGRTEMANPPGSAYAGIVHCRDLSAKPILVDLVRADLS